MPLVDTGRKIWRGKRGVSGHALLKRSDDVISPDGYSGNE